MTSMSTGTSTMPQIAPTITLATMKEILDHIDDQRAAEDKRLRSWMASKGCAVERGWSLVLPMSATRIDLSRHDYVRYSNIVATPCFVRMPLPAQDFPFHIPPGATR